MSTNELTLEYLRKVLNYNPNTGWFTWTKHRASKRVRVGSRAGTLGSGGYRTISVLGKRYREHTLVWFWVNGVMPEREIDHIDQDRGNNSYKNLREATKQDNSRNRAMYSSNTTGYNGVQYNKRTDKWIALIRTKEGTLFHKTFSDIEEAIEAREAKAKDLGFHVNHGRVK